ncbi:DUF418 domain-containing protein [Alkalimonas amylolytica]|uniref:DUF418 domain-containing protein n=1 Tax=Alkalimonas amylolytica TaxID=152573 RepID=A0A1H4BNF0_ALKAM|nr:DUF418 domain-containing protein [Alkalimonas amylolytica]SEA49705.1 uncharacterized protein SAMN04488051_103448 [Alkalimonas amylolytica]
MTAEQGGLGSNPDRIYFQQIYAIFNTSYPFGPQALHGLAAIMTTTTTTLPSPVAPAERMLILDVIRGFALFGILMMNIEYFQRPLQALMLGFNSEQSGLDYAVAWLSFTFVQGKFYTLFSLLFGLGFIVFIDRARQKGAAAPSLFRRRLWVLLAIGVVHLLLIWGGDILHFYAVVGFLLLFFVNASVKRLCIWAAVLLLTPILLIWLGTFALEMAMQVPEEAAKLKAGFAADKEKLLADIARGDLLYASGGYWQVVQWRVYEFQALYLSPALLLFVPMILGIFLLGAALGRSGLLQTPEQHKVFFWRLMWLGYSIGLPLTLIWGIYGTEVEMVSPSIRNALLMTCQNLSNVALCLAYMATLVHLYLHKGHFIRLLAPAGRMALTNYLLHSVVFTLLFYGYGLGLYGDFGRAATTLMALLLYGLQLWLSHWWLQRYRSGPMEWLWRTLTYGHRQPFRIQPLLSS